VQDLRSDPGSKYQFQSNMALNDAYQRTMLQFTKCLTGSVLRNELAIEPRIDRTNGTASIAYKQRSIMNNGYIAIVDFSTRSGGTFVVVNGVSHTEMPKLGPQVESWLQGSESCVIGNWISHRYPIIE
jgi:hypothetical protein